ncbi:glycoside hydrolase family 3 C-terminal domain-containing protein [Brachybacterium sp. MASK1Z-5]|uniref:Glycoside hydrolase family 3 C-terminal domain-containing protein n=1 Tax=Brachybacterium halotolerans TaxID=2795215 RepID=A0ABS1B8P3_9MICO|nr:glycoside hydrolase family 3 N-terminal domain-containing protein [Brachybacterium halotolerans]MBK0331010.1 glycoside hydrolase family 3 C-terminal domain-containing protein [Brachybacterium halotolerans]
MTQRTPSDPQSTPSGPRRNPSAGSADPSADVSALSQEEKIALTGGADFWHLHAAPSLGLGQIQVSDGPHGLRQQSGAADNLGLNDSVEATCFPPAVGLASTWSRSSAAAVAGAIAEEALAGGVSVVLGPGMNIKRSPLCGRNFEYFSEDPHLAGELATAFVDGMQQRGVGTSVKHFALNNQETDRMRVDVDVDERTMHEIYLRAFRTVVTRAQPWTVMCSYNSVDGTPVARNRRLLTEILREQWGFEGLVVSDWGAVEDRPASVQAGLDLQMPADPFGEQDLREAVARGDVDQEALDRAAGKAVALLRRGLAAADPDAAYDAEAHHRIAVEAARRALVLLENDGTLPLAEPGDGAGEGTGAGTASDAEGLVVIGDFAQTPRYQGAGSSHVNPTRLTDALGAIRAIAGEDVPFARGFVPGAADGETDAAPSPEALRAEAVELARGARTAVLFLGLGEDVESEGFDRTDIELPADQLQLLEGVREVAERVVVVLSNGSVVRLPEALRGVNALLEGWLLGQGGGEATADILFGRANPSGRLAETIPLRLQDTPSYLHFPGEDSHVRYGEGLFVGYRGFDAVDAEVAYPFGHGLSFTTFAQSDLAVTASARGGIDLEVTVENTGDRAGREIVQAYVSVPGSRVTRAPRELKGFAEVELAPGESRRVGISVPAEDLQYWSPAAGSWVVESGTYRVEVGASSRDLGASADVEIAGDEPRPVMTMTSTPLEIRALPGGEEALGSLLGDSGLFADPEMLKMAEQIPVGRFTGLGGFGREQLQEMLDRVNRG